MAHTNAPQPVREPGGELVVDAGLHQEAAGTGAALAVEAVDHEHHGVEGAVEVGVVEHDHRILAAQLEVQPLEGGRRLGLDQRSGGRLAHEGHRRNGGMLGQGAARAVIAHAVHHVQHAGGEVRRRPRSPRAGRR